MRKANEGNCEWDWPFEGRAPTNPGRFTLTLEQPALNLPTLNFYVRCGGHDYCSDVTDAPVAISKSPSLCIQTDALVLRRFIMEIQYRRLPHLLGRCRCRSLVFW